MITLATAATIFFSGVTGGSATIITEGLIEKHNTNPDRINKVSTKIVEKAKNKSKAKYEKAIKKNPDIEITTDQIDEDFKAEADKLIKKSAIKDTLIETAIPSVVGGLVTAGVIALCSAIADGCADDSDEDVDEE